MYAEELMKQIQRGKLESPFIEFPPHNALESFNQFHEFLNENTTPKKF